MLHPLENPCHQPVSEWIGSEDPLDRDSILAYTSHKALPNLLAAWGRHVINRRRLISSAVALTATGHSTSLMAASSRTSSLAWDIGEMLMFGFAGNTIDSPSARILADHIAAGRVGAVFFVKANVGSRDDVLALVRLFSAGSTPLIAIDHEGGFVQRLGKRHGFTPIPTARSIAAGFSVDHARSLYTKAATELSAIGFNMNLAPVVDLDDPDSPAIGRFERAFHSNPAKVAAYAEAFIKGFSCAGIQCVLKHFPGAGHSHSDSHRSLPEVTPTWSEQELEPYSKIIASGRAGVIMSGHLHLATIEKDPIPIALSRAAITGMLRGKLGFSGVAMTDDLDMAPVSSVMERGVAAIRAIAAGNDLLMIGNSAEFDPDLPQKIAGLVQRAISEGTLLEARVAESANRIRKLKLNLLPLSDGRPQCN